MSVPATSCEQPFALADARTADSILFCIVYIQTLPIIAQSDHEATRQSVQRQPDNQPEAIRQSGNQAINQAINQTIRQPGNQTIRPEVRAAPGPSTRYGSIDCSSSPTHVSILSGLHLTATLCTSLLSPPTSSQLILPALAGSYSRIQDISRNL